MRKLVRDILTRAKLDCIEAADGESGLRLAATHPVSTAVVSLHLPGPGALARPTESPAPTCAGMGGLELAWRLHSERPALCIVGLSDYAELWDADRLRGIGIRRVLSAPFGPEELLRAICPSAALSAVRGTALASAREGDRRARTVSAERVSGSRGAWIGGP
jgi:CheY-like chemotaxis protein